MVGKKIGKTTMENSMKVFKKIKNRVTIWPSNPSSEYLLKKSENNFSQRYMHPYVHCSISLHGQDTETTEISLVKWLDKNDVVRTYTMNCYSAIRKGECCHLQ